jgi:hypothetical protein
LLLFCAISHSPSDAHPVFAVNRQMRGDGFGIKR